MIRLLLPAILLLTSAVAEAAPSNRLSERVGDVLAALKQRTEPRAVFAPSFIAAVPPAKLAQTIRQIEAGSGKLIAAADIRPQTQTTVRFTLRFERALAVATLSVEAAAPNRVTGFRITAVTPIGDSTERIAADFAALPGRSGFAVTRLADGGAPAPILSAHAGEPFAIGSAFKLWVLDALAEDIAAGRHRWDEVVRLGPRSLPSGITQDWPPGAPVTVETLATLMISMSDNTATDTLIRLIGRERVDDRVRATGHASPARMLPVLTTAEVFALKLSPPAAREAYARADEAGRNAILAGLGTAGILSKADVTALDSGPAAIDQIEWFAAPDDIVRVLDALRRRPDPRVLAILNVTPTMVDDLRERFTYVGYKGGSEVGVIELSWLVRGKSGAWLVVTASWNDPAAAIDSGRFELLTQRLVRFAADHS